MSGAARLRAGVVGLGAMGRHHARVLAELPGVELVGCADPAGNVHAAPIRCPVVAGVDELLALGLDYCVVAVPTALHELTALQLADAGVHTLVEKPLAADAAAARRIADAFERAGLVAAVGHIERFNPALRALRARLAAGQLGELYQVATSRLSTFPARVADVGVILDLASHDIDMTAWVAGSRYTEVSAQTARRSGRAHEDLVAAVGRLADGTVVSHLVNWLSPMKERLTVVTGERGALVANTLTADLTFYANGTDELEWDGIRQFRGVSEGDVTRYAIAKPEPLRVEHEAFRDAVAGTGADIVTAWDGVTVVTVAEALVRAAATGTTVAVASCRPVNGGR